MTLSRKKFFVTLGGLSLIPLVGCKTTGGWTESDTAKLAATLEQAGFVLALKLGTDAEKRKYLELAATSLELVIADGKLDPSDILTVVLANVKNDDVVIGITTALTIYRIWWNDSLPSTVQGVTVIAALIKGLRDGLMFKTFKFALPATSSIPTFKSKSLDNAVKYFFKKY